LKLLLKKETMKNKSFTLIEILVVIIIVGLLAGLIITSTSSYIEEANIAKAHSFSSKAKNELMFNILQEWKFDEGSGNTIYDINKSSNTGTLSAFYSTLAGGGDSGNSGWLSDEYCVSGTCLNFDGVNNSNVDIVDTGSLPLFTLTTWVYNNASNDANRHSILRNFWEIVAQNVCFWSSDFSIDYWRCSSNSKVTFHKWSYVVTVWDGSYISHYVNGELSYKDTALATGSGQSLYMIAGYDTRRMVGRLDEMIIYDKDLTVSEIKQTYLAGLDSLLAQGGLTEDEYNQRIGLLAQN